MRLDRREPAAPPSEPARTPDAPRQGMYALYEQKLREVDRLETPEGAHVMLLARLLDADSHTASGAAALSRELRAALEATLKDAPRKADAFDELGKRRQQKLSSA